MDWKAIVAGVAPTIGTALLGPGGGMAVKFLGDKLLGDKDATEKEVQAFVENAGPDQLIALKGLEMEFNKLVADLGLNLEKLANEDTAGARHMQEAALESNDPLARRFVYYFMMFWSVAAVAYIGAITFTAIPESNVRFADTILGFLLGTIVASMFKYLFGTTAGSKLKTMLSHMKT